ncbi:TonB-dependent receptor [Flaviaesturariibacter aridisoli]|uniref:TonB-dependent receptor n=1 Tax=Flaviaesturariibacter aridisoli TaxID=2545761 RepID=A0A4R4E581_9BACT|nr:TonB-dependent receptor [Flaviaesturariibacter aridisoli]TCZ74784.1 TonB-dependent receptor [Flaviaesturariibacter aridisoli]
MRSFSLLFCLLLIAGLAGAQPLSGTVRDARGAAVAGASLTIKGSYDGGTSDSSGRFSFASTEKGAQVLLVSAIGYKSWEGPVQLTGSPLQLSVQLKEEVTELKAVVISAGSFEASDKKKTTVLSPIDIVTTASALADVTGAVKTLPGAQQVGESEGLFVRGGTAQETKTFIDGTLVNNFFYSSVPNVAQRSRFSPFIFKGTVFSAGGYSALYGQALSSALILESIDLPEQSSGQVGVSVLGVSGGLQKLSKNKKASWGASYGYTNVGLGFALIKLRDEYFGVPQYHTADANFRIKTGRTGMLKYYGYFSFNKLGLRQQSIDTIGYKDAFALRNNNMYHNLSWRGSLGGRWKLQLGASYSTNRDDIDAQLVDGQNDPKMVAGFEQKNFGLVTKGRYINAKAVFEYRLRGLSALRLGSEYNYSSDRSDYTLFNGQQFPNAVTEHGKALFGEADLYITNALAARVGMRAEHSALLDKVNAAPRLSLAYKVGKEGQASLAYGEFYQTPERRYLSAPVTLDYAKATHYIAQYQRVSPKQTLRTEVFYKKYRSLLKTGVLQGRETATGTGGYGEAAGFELFWRDKQTFKGLDYWISYSYLDTKRDYLNFPAALEPSFAAKHTASLVLKRFIPAIKTGFNLSYTYASGRPYYNIGYDNGSGKFQLTDAGRTIDYHSASFSMNYLPKLFSKGAGKNTVLVASVTNFLGNKQVYGYKYAQNGSRKEAITPPTNMFFFLGAFISFGVDRTEDIINNNL